MRNSLAAFLMLALTACGWLPEKVDESRTWSANKLYSEAKTELSDGNFEKAIKLYESLEARYPYGRYAQQAQMEIAYAYYKSGERVQAVAAADRFIKLHPNHPNVDYMYYLKGLVTFNEDLGPMETVASYFTEWDLSDRDPKSARESFDAFKELVTRYPNSKYAPDATLRLKYLVNALAFHEIHAARYYLLRGAYLAAANRAQYVLQTYPQAPANEEALYILSQAYGELGLTELRNDAMRVMQTNFPSSRFITGKGENSSWWKFW
ncbi:MAG TPA: outer membrane protein assembly factor BamD [Burkholderiales bacterium]|nr:outer membrane protein assembly factor BamD [Burkholderiales bacterium]